MSDDRSLRDSVAHYIDHLEETAWVERLVDAHGLDTVLDACVDVLVDSQSEGFQDVATFLRDIGMGVVAPDLKRQARERMPSRVLPALRTLLTVPVSAARKTAIYTLGKLSFASEAKAIRHALPYYVVHDPFCVARGLGELAWLGDPDGVQACLNDAVEHISYLVRWSVLAHAGERLRTLASDREPLVAAEAAYEMAQRDLDRAGHESQWHPKSEWEKKKRTLEASAPTLTFADVEIRFSNDMVRRGALDFTVGELEAFVRALENGSD